MRNISLQSCLALAAKLQHKPTFPAKYYYRSFYGIPAQLAHLGHHAGLLQGGYQELP